jgi:hypothetical protein
MHNRKMAIGWTPFAIMHHLQFVDKNATKEDIGRRYYNNGIGAMYHLYSHNGFQTNFSAYLRYLVYYVLAMLTAFTAGVHRKSYFYHRFFKGGLSFFNMWKDPSYREQVQRSDWF